MKKTPYIKPDIRRFFFINFHTLFKLYIKFNKFLYNLSNPLPYYTSFFIKCKKNIIYIVFQTLCLVDEIYKFHKELRLL